LSAHFLAIAQVLVYGGAIMVLFLFIIMLLNLKDEELGEVQFKLHHLVAGAACVGLLSFLIIALTPLSQTEQVKTARLEAGQQYATAVEAHEKEVAAVASEADSKVRAKRYAELAQRAPQRDVQVKTPVPGLNADLSEAALNRLWLERLTKYKNGGMNPATGKFQRFDDSKPMEIPPRLTGEGLVTKHGSVPKLPPATFGTVEPISLLMVGRFVLPFELTAILLMAAICGAVIIAKRRL
jgi:NADH-quinone oxidoreductase subunit J